MTMPVNGRLPEQRSLEMKKRLRLWAHLGEMRKAFDYDGLDATQSKGTIQGVKTVSSLQEQRVLDLAE